MDTAEVDAKKAEYKQRLREREETIRESWVHVMETRIVREKLQTCHRMEGVNHYENCKELADRYLQLLRETKLKGYRQIDVL